MGQKSASSIYEEFTKCTGCMCSENQKEEEEVEIFARGERFTI